MSLFTYTLCEPGETPRKDARRNSIDSSEDHPEAVEE
jgi:hypothetical protein